MKFEFRLLLILFLAFIVRVYHLGEKPLHFDEKSSVACALGIPYAGINQVKSSTWQQLGLDSSNFTKKDLLKRNTLYHVYRSSLEDNGSILYFVTLHFWINTFGASNFSVRFLSLIFSCFSVLLIFYLAFEITASERIAFFSSFLLAIQPLSIASGQFCRSHAMAGFFSLAATIVFFQFRNQKRFSVKNIVLYSLCCAAAMLCHYFTMYVFIAHVLVMLVYVRGRVIWLNFIAGGLLALFFFTIWLVLGGLEGLRIVSEVHEQFYSQTQNWKQGDNPYYIPATFKNLMGGWVQVLLPLFGNSFQNFGLRLSQIFWMLLVPVCLFTFINYKENKKASWILLIMIVSQPIWATLMSVRMGYMIFLQPIYAQYALPFSSILLAYCTWHLYTMSLKKVAIAVVLLQIAIMTFSIYTIYYLNVTKDYNFDAIATDITKMYKKGDIISYNNWNDAFFTGILLTQENIPQKIANQDGRVRLIRDDNTFFEIK